MPAQPRDQRAVRAARRAAKRAATSTDRRFSVLPPAIKQGHSRAVRKNNIDYAAAVLNGEIPAPGQGTREGNRLASVAGLSRWGRVDGVYEAAFSGYWYHTNNESSERREEQ